MLSMEAIIYRALRNATDRASPKGLGPMSPRMRVIKILTSGYLTIDSTSSAGRLGAKFNVERGAEEMRIFVAYGYNERDRWIPRLVFLIRESIKIRGRWR
jgi:hypothetical protein